MRLVRSHRCSPRHRALKLHTEASTRFGRGADPDMAEVASRRCAELILQLAGGELLSGVVDVYPGKRAPKKLLITRAELLRVMGADVPDKEIEAILSALGFAPVRVDQNRGANGSILAFGNVRNRPGAPKFPAKSILSKRSHASSVSTICASPSCRPPGRRALAAL